MFTDEPDIYSDSLKNEYFSWYNLQIIPTFVNAHLHREPPSLDVVEEELEDEDLQGDDDRYLTARNKHGKFQRLTLPSSSSSFSLTIQLN